MALAIPDFLHAMRHYLARAQPREVLWYWDRISDYLWRHGRYPEYVQCDHYALAAAAQLAANSAESGRLTAKICAELAFAHMELGEPDLAEGYVREAERLCRELGDTPGLVRALRYRATLRCRLGDHDAAVAFCRQALGILDDVGHDGQAVVRCPLHTLLGIVRLEQGDHPAARRELLTALKGARTLGEDRVYWSLAPLFNLGGLYERRSEPTHAQRYYRRCITLTDAGVNLGIRAQAALRLAMLLAGDGRAELAKSLTEEAIRLFDTMGKYSEKMDALRFLRTLG